VASVMPLTEHRFFIEILHRSHTQMEPPMANITGLAKSTTELRHEVGMSRMTLIGLP